MPKIYFDGIDLEDIGIKVCGDLSLSPAVPNIETVSVPGRNGDLHFFDGTYANRKAVVPCYVYRDDLVKEAFGFLNSFFFGTEGYKRLYSDDDPDHFLLARLVETPPLEARLRRMAPFELVFDCKPQRFLIDGEQPIVITSNEFKFFNPTRFKALPLIYIDNAYDVTYITVNGIDLEVLYSNQNEFRPVYDAETNSYYFADRESGDIGVADVPKKQIVLHSGENSVKKYQEAVKIEIVPRWWEL